MHLDGYGAVFGIASLLIVSLVIAVSLLPVRVVRQIRHHHGLVRLRRALPRW